MQVPLSSLSQLFSLGNLLNQFEDGFWKLIELPSYGPLHSNQFESSIENHTKDYAKSSLYQVWENLSLEFFFMVCFMVKMA
jgi:hypothetical protein